VMRAQSGARTPAPFAVSTGTHHDEPGSDAPSVATTPTMRVASAVSADGDVWAPSDSA
jgi:hypothetical protein